MRLYAGDQSLCGALYFKVFLKRCCGGRNHMLSRFGGLAQPIAEYLLGAFNTVVCDEACAALLDLAPNIDLIRNQYRSAHRERLGDHDTEVFLV